MSDIQSDIWRLQAQGDVRGLLEAAKHPDAETRKRAVAAIRALGASSAIPGLQTLLVKEIEPAVRAAIIMTLDHLFQQELDDDDDELDDHHMRVVRLIAELSSRDPGRVTRAARALGDLRDKMAAESLVLLFHNQSLPAAARLAAAEALLKLESAPVEVSLLRALRHADARVRRNAAAVLGQLNADWAVEPLAAAMRQDAHEVVRRTAEAALQRIGTTEALAALKTTPPAAAAPPAPPAEPAKPGTPAQPEKTTPPAAAAPPAPPAEPAKPGTPAQPEKTTPPAAAAPPAPPAEPAKPGTPAQPEKPAPPAAAAPPAPPAAPENLPLAADGAASSSTAETPADSPPPALPERPSPML